MHVTALEILGEEADDQVPGTTQLYGKNDVLPLHNWMPPWGMDKSALAVYCQTVEMTEPQLQDL